MKRFLKIFFSLLTIAAVFYVLSIRAVPEKVDYGVSFSKLHSDELKLNWKETYLAILDDLPAKRLRLSAHWPMIEPREGEYDFGALDYQMKEAKIRNVSVILSVGLRLPGWPECHKPDWAAGMPEEKLRERLLDYIRAAVDRYKGYPNLRYWQVENELFLRFATEYCDKGDEEFLSREIDLVKKLDPKHKILVTDSGEFGKWYKARRHGDVFGTSVYLYIWHDILGPLRYPLTPGFFRFKQNLIDLISGPKETILIELGAEPWLAKPIVDAPIPEQFERMGIDKFKRVIEFNRRTGFAEQYLWGAEWWYYMKLNGHSEFWDTAKELFSGK